VNVSHNAENEKAFYALRKGISQFTKSHFAVDKMPFYELRKGILQVMKWLNAKWDS
jgi:hypothetical protein